MREVRACSGAGVGIPKRPAFACKLEQPLSAVARGRTENVERILKQVHGSPEADGPGTATGRLARRE